MNYKHFFIITGVICMFWTNSVTAQQMIKWRGSDGWGLASRYEEHFNKWNLETISGPISVIDTVTPLVDMAYGVQLIVKSRHEEVSVHLALFAACHYLDHLPKGGAFINSHEVFGSFRKIHAGTEGTDSWPVNVS